jgi:hypothetical protein
MAFPMASEENINSVSGLINFFKEFYVNNVENGKFNTKGVTCMLSNITLGVQLKRIPFLKEINERFTALPIADRFQSQKGRALANTFIPVLLYAHQNLYVEILVTFQILVNASMVQQLLSKSTFSIKKLTIGFSTSINFNDIMTKFRDYGQEGFNFWITDQKGTPICDEFLNYLTSLQSSQNNTDINVPRIPFIKTVEIITVVHLIPIHPQQMAPPPPKSEEIPLSFLDKVEDFNDNDIKSFEQQTQNLNSQLNKKTVETFEPNHQSPPLNEKKKNNHGVRSPVNLKIPKHEDLNIKAQKFLAQRKSKSFPINPQLLSNYSIEPVDYEDKISTIRSAQLLAASDSIITSKSIKETITEEEFMNAIMEGNQTNVPEVNHFSNSFINNYTQRQETGEPIYNEKDTNLVNMDIRRLQKCYCDNIFSKTFLIKSSPHTRISFTDWIVPDKLSTYIIQKTPTSQYTIIQTFIPDRKRHLIWTLSQTTDLFQSRPVNCFLIERYLGFVAYISPPYKRAVQNMRDMSTFLTYDYDGHPINVLVPCYNDEQFRSYKEMENRVVCFKHLLIDQQRFALEADYCPVLEFAILYSRISVIYDSSKFVSKDDLDGKIPIINNENWKQRHTDKKLLIKEYSNKHLNEEDINNVPSLSSYFGFMPTRPSISKELLEIGFNFSSITQIRVIINDFYLKDVPSVAEEIFNEFQPGDFCLFLNILRKESKSSNHTYYLYIQGLSIIVPLNNLRLKKKLINTLKEVMNEEWEKGKILQTSAPIISINEDIFSGYRSQGFNFKDIGSSVIDVKFSGRFLGQYIRQVTHYDYLPEIGFINHEFFTIRHHGPKCGNKGVLCREKSDLPLGFLACKECGAEFEVFKLYQKGVFSPGTHYKDQIFTTHWCVFFSIAKGIIIKCTDDNVMYGWTGFLNVGEYITECLRQGRPTYGTSISPTKDPLVVLLNKMCSLLTYADFIVRLREKKLIKGHDSKIIRQKLQNYNLSHFWTSLKDIRFNDKDFNYKNFENRGAVIFPSKMGYARLTSNISDPHGESGIYGCAWDSYINDIPYNKQEWDTYPAHGIPPTSYQMMIKLISMENDSDDKRDLFMDYIQQGISISNQTLLTYRPEMKYRLERGHSGMDDPSHDIELEQLPVTPLQTNSNLFSPDFS